MVPPDVRFHSIPEPLSFREVRLRSGDIRNLVRAQDLTGFLLDHAGEYELDPWEFWFLVAISGGRLCHEYHSEVASSRGGNPGRHNNASQRTVDPIFRWLLELSASRERVQTEAPEPGIMVRGA